MIRQDYILRLIQQAAEFVKQVVGMREKGDYDGALDEAQRGYEELLGMPPGLSDRVDAATLAQMLKHPETIRAAARLSWEEGHIYKAKRDPLTAFERYRRAHELFLEARAIEPHEDDDNAILELSRLVPARDLAPRYRGE